MNPVANIGGWTFLAVILFLIIWVIATYNTLVRLRNYVTEAWAQIDTELKRRYDLIPNLVETVKGYAAHEASTLEKVVQARNMAASAGSVEDRIRGENMLTGALKSLFALAEAYPDAERIDWEKEIENAVSFESIDELRRHLLEKEDDESGSDDPSDCQTGNDCP